MASAAADCSLRGHRSQDAAATGGQHGGRARLATQHAAGNSMVGESILNIKIPHERGI